jgi:hypothetical protein
VLAYCLAAAGEWIMGRRSRTLTDWNISFQVGVSLTATLFIPLSLLFHGYALNATGVGLILAGAWGGVRRRGVVFARLAPVTRSVPTKGWAGWLMLAVLFLAVAQFAIENYRFTYIWDGYQIWATKALVIYDRGSLTQDLLTPHESDLMRLPNCCDGTERVTGYPQTVSLLEALIAKPEGRFNWEAVKAIFPILFVSLIFSTYQAARAFVPRTVALAACTLLVLVPAVSLKESIGGYADMPQAVLVAGSMAAVLMARGSGMASYRLAAPWVLGGMVMVKSEGFILFGVACAVIAVTWASRGPQKFVAALRAYSGAILVALSCAAMRVLYLNWVSATDPTYGPFDKRHFMMAYQRLWDVPAICAHYMFDRATWGVFWPVFFLAVPVVIWKGDGKVRALTAAILTALAAYTGVFYFTNWEIHLHIEQAYSRLLVHLSPVAAVLVVVAYQYLAAGRLAGSESTPATPTFPQTKRPLAQ